MANFLSNIRNSTQLFGNSRVNRSTAEGFFDPLNCIIELKENHAAALPKTENDMSAESSLSQGVFIHETIHWWQISGTTSGFLYALAHSSQSIGNLGYISRFESEELLQKPLVALLGKEINLSNDDMARFNIVTNNWYDIEYCLAILLNPHETNIQAHLFESAGHSFRILYSNVLTLLQGTFNHHLSLAFNGEEWRKYFLTLSEEKVENYYYGSPLHLPSVGLIHLMEGHARFSELQLLCNFYPDDFEFWNDKGYFDEDYIYAWIKFIQETELAQPDSFYAPEVYLFLLIIDIAFNVEQGYPFPLNENLDFVGNNHPGTRFLVICNFIKGNKNIVEKLTEISYSSYQEVTQEICNSLGWHTPDEIAKKIVNDSLKNSPIIELNQEYQTNNFAPNNYPQRIFYARHLSIMEDRIKYPEFFCWPGHYSTHGGDKSLSFDTCQELLLKHQVPFVYNYESNSMGYLMPGNTEYSHDNDIVTNYFTAQMVNLLVRQWVEESGPFNFNFRWIDNKHSVADFEARLVGEFERMTGIDMGRIRY